MSKKQFWYFLHKNGIEKGPFSVASVHLFFKNLEWCIIYKKKIAVIFSFLKINDLDIISINHQEFIYCFFSTWNTFLTTESFIHNQVRWLNALCDLGLKFTDLYYFANVQLLGYKIILSMHSGSSLNIFVDWN